MKATTKRASLVAAAALASVVALSLGVSGIFASAADDDGYNDGTYGRFYTAYQSKDEAYAATERMNLDLEEEGIVMLKNDGKLPLSTNSKVSVFGIAQDCIVESSGDIATSLENAGFKVNDVLKDFYLSDGLTESSYGSETSLTAKEKQSVSLYNDVGVIVLGRGGSGESSMGTGGSGETEDEKYLGEDQGWTHEASPSNQKHGLELTQSEQDLIEYVEGACKKVVVLYSGEQVFEMGNLQDDENIDAIYWIGRPGDGGMDAVGEVLAGTVNPSGKTVDEWTRDLTNDPTYANVATTSYSSTSYNGIDYEEDIYLGYKFYETYYVEASSSTVSIPGLSMDSASADEWYDYNVVYPFGYGLSYTSFSYELEGVTTDTGAEISSANLYNSTNQSGIKTLYVDVCVTNTGSVAGRDTVEIYAEAPYTSGEIEKPAWSLVGFAKTDELEKGESETVTVEIDIQDIASYDYADKNEDGSTGYTLDMGSYTLHIMQSSSNKNIAEKDDDADAYAAYEFTLSDTVVLDLDTYSGNEVENWFSGSTGDGDAWKDEYDSMLVANDAQSMTLLSRADFDSTMPSARTGSETLSTATVDLIGKYINLYAESFDDTGMPWEQDVTALDGWTQGTGVADSNGLYDITLDMMAGVDFDDPLWTTFMNQLTWDEIKDTLNNGFHLTNAVESIGKVQTRDDNGPNYVNNGPSLVGTPTRSATWNTELMYQSGIVNANTSLAQNMTGWYAPGMNTHRSPFGGRVPEYFSQDGVQGGYMAAAMVSAMTECGLNVYVKHFALYDSGAGTSTCVNASEQNMRENYLKVFQMSMQEGNAHATMTSFNKIGAVYAGQNYALIQGLARSEWGWTGYCVTDTTSSITFATMDGLVRAGADIPDGDFTGDSAKNLSGTWDAEYNWSEELGAGVSVTTAPVGAVILTDANGTEYASATQWYCGRMAAQRVLYNAANSAGNNNGITVQETENYTLSVSAIQADTITSVSIVDTSILERGHEITGVEISAGSLPDGLYIEDGMLQGKPTVSGSFSVDLDVYLDGWVALSTTLNIDVAASIEMEFDVSSVTKNASVDVYVIYDESLDTFGSDYTFTFEVIDGSLPIGLQMDETTGQITGEPLVSGSYTFTIAVGVVDPNGWVVNFSDYQYSVWQMQVMMGHPEYADLNVFCSALAAGEVYVGSTPGEEYWPSDCYWPAEMEYYYITYTMTVVDGGSTGSGSTGEAGRGIASMEINSDGELVVSYTDGTSQNLGPVVGSGESSATTGVVSVTQSGTQLVITYADGTTSYIDMNVTVDEEGNVVVGVASMEINSNGELVVSYTDGTSQNLGTVVGADGKDGADGSGCGSAVELAGAAIVMAIVLAAAAAVYVVSRKRRNISND